MRLVTHHLSLVTYDFRVSSDCGGAAMAESPAIWNRVAARPLEPDAGNAAEGSEGPMPDWDFQPCDFSRMAFL